MLEGIFKGIFLATILFIVTKIKERKEAKHKKIQEHIIEKEKEKEKEKENNES